MGGLVGFLHREQVQSETAISVIIVHGGYSHDFPILIANCMKYDYGFRLTAPSLLVRVWVCASFYMRVLVCLCLLARACACVPARPRVLERTCACVHMRAGLCVLACDLIMRRNGHSAFEDAEILMTICKSKSEIFNQQYGFTFENILHHLDQKF